MRAFGLRGEVHRYYPGYEAWVSMEGGRLLVHDVWWPYGEFRQKCTLPICNIPIVRRLVQQLTQIGIEEIIVVVGHHAQQVISVTADLPNVTFVTQKIS